MKFDTNFDADPNEDDPARRAKVTEYAKAQGGWYEDSEKSAYYGNGFWWLRSPFGFSEEFDIDSGFLVMIISANGVVFEQFVKHPFYVVRPAL